MNSTMPFQRKGNGWVLVQSTILQDGLITFAAGHGQNTVRCETQIKLDLQIEIICKRFATLDAHEYLLQEGIHQGDELNH